MRTSIILIVPSFVCLYLPARAQSSFPTADGISRAPAVTLHCLGANGVAGPCGTSTMPLVVTGGTGGSGLATAANQASQLQSAQALTLATGTQQDAAYAGGAGSTISLLKGMVVALTAGVTATPVSGIPVSRSLSITAAQSTMIFPVNGSRHYLAFQAPAGTSLWVNFVGGAAAPNGIDCVQITSGTLYESGQFVTRGPVFVYSPIASPVSAWEG